MVTSGLFVLMDFYESLQGQVTHDISIVANYCLIIYQEIFDVFQPSRGFKKDWLVAKGDWNPPPLHVWKLLVIYFRVMVGVDDEVIHADPDKVVHGVGDDGSTANLKERLRTMLGQGPEPCSQASTKNKSSLKTSFNQTSLTSQGFSGKPLSPAHSSC